MIGDQPLKTRKFNKKYVGGWVFGDGLKMEILKMAGTGS